MESKNSRIHLGERLSSDINELLVEFENSNRFIVNTIYNDYILTKDIINFLNYNTQDYIMNKLDTYVNSNQLIYEGIEKFVSNSFISDDKIKHIAFISKEMNEVRLFNKLLQISTTSIDNYSELMNRLSNIYFYEDYIIYVNLINNPDSLEEEGRVLICYSLSEIEQIISHYGDHYNALLINQQTQTLYNLNKKTPIPINQYLSEINALEEGKEYKSTNKMSHIKANFSKDLNVLTEISTSNLINKPHIFYSSILLLNIVLIVISLAILKFKLRKLTTRTDTILNVMEEVKEGNLKVQIPIDEEKDEITYISSYFNQMVTDLDTYINKSYLAEINQKKAEMIAFQNQINPHFLYNTLECIRMKAVCNGDREVGKMLYHLSYLFRKQVKDNHIITLESELEYCQRYMEIFKFRYPEKFSFTIDYPKELAQSEMIKFTIQPLVENYFVHGICLERSDNLIEIKVSRHDDDIQIIIDDNGKGIEESKLKKLNENLNSKLEHLSAHQSIGIINSQARIIGLYGEKYGIKLSNNNQGARITILIPNKRGVQV